MTRFQRFLFIYELLGGLIGIAFGFLLTPTFLAMPGGIFVLIFFESLSLLSCVAGILIWKRNSKAFLLSVISQASQVPAVAFSAFAYKFGLGILFIPSIEWTPTNDGSLHLGFPVEFQIVGCRFNLSFGSGSPSFMVGVNLVALIVLVMILKRRKQFQQASIS
jgi:hypothetical protein